MITSFIPGRVRLRHPAFRDPGYCASVTALAQEHPALKAVRANPVTGSLLIEYDPDEVDPAAAAEALAAIDPEAAQGREERQSRASAEDPPDTPEAEAPGLENAPAGWGSVFRRADHELLAMTGAFIVCSGSAVLRSKGWHVYSGLALAGLIAQHLYRYRRRLFPGLK